MSEAIVKTKLKISGMSCGSCALTIEDTLKKIRGIIQVDVSYVESLASVYYDSTQVSLEDIKSSIKQAGYSVADENEALKNYDTSNNHKDNKRDGIITITAASIILLSLYLIINNTIGFNFIPEVNHSMGYGILFVVGLLTSIHCIAMCGGINLSQSVAKAPETDKRFKEKLKPSLLYNAGRVISYTVIGGIVGALGSVISFSGTAKGIVALVAGVFMIIMGLNMLNLFPWLRKLIPRLPKSLAGKIHGAKSNKGPLIVGLLNGLMPCGPLQTMQLYALGTGSALTGALSMFLFSLGTVPLMFGFGAVSSILSSKFTKKMMAVSAVLVMFLGVVMFGRGLSQSGVSTAIASKSAGNIAVVEENIQNVTTNMEPNVYEPLTVQAGIPVRWTIIVEEGDLNGCNNPITIPKYGIEKELILGENVIEFTPTEEGNVVYTCWMGMISGNIQVVPDISNTNDANLQQDIYEIDESLESGACCAAGLEDIIIEEDTVQETEAAIGEIADGVQVVSINVNEFGFSPALVIVQKDIETKWIIYGDKLDACNNSLIFPLYNARLNLQTGENLIEFTPTQDFSFSCWMGMINGYVKVVDDINNIDLEQIKSEVSTFESQAVAGCCG